MKRAYYIFSSGRMQRHQNTLYLRKFSDEDESLAGEDIEDAAALSGCPLEDLEDEDALAELDFDEGHYTPRPTLATQPIPVNNVEAIYLFGECDFNSRFFNILKTMRYYKARGRDVDSWIQSIESHRLLLPSALDVPTVMGIEGTIRATYYGAWPSRGPSSKRVSSVRPTTRSTR